jgi:hypothetical protein
MDFSLDGDCLGLVRFAFFRGCALNGESSAERWHSPAMLCHVDQLVAEQGGSVRVSAIERALISQDVLTDREGFCAERCGQLGRQRRSVNHGAGHACSKSRLVHGSDGGV